MQGAFTYCQASGDTPIGLSAPVVEAQFGEFNIIIDPSMISPSAFITAKFGGRLTGSGSAVFRFRVGGNYNGNGGTWDGSGTLLATSESESAPGGLGLFTWDIGEVMVGSDITRIFITYQNDGASTLGINDAFLILEGVDIPPPNPRYKFDRGMRWANVSVFPDKDQRDLVHGSSRIWHVNSVEQIQHPPIGRVTVDVNGVIRNRFIDPRKLQVPVAVRHFGRKSTDRFGQAAFPFSSGSQG